MNIDRVLFAFAVLGLSVACVGPASSANSVAFVKSTGSGAACTLAAPCSNMSSAVSVAGANGEVVCLDKHSYGFNLQLTFSITFSCGDGLWEAPAWNQFSIFNPASTSVDIIIEGLILDGLGTGGDGIVFNGQGTLRLRKARFGNFAPSGNGILFQPSGPATLQITDSVFYNSVGSGVLIKPSGSGYANVHIRNSRFERNAHGLFIDGSNSTIGVNVNISESVFTENAGNGIGASTTAGKAPVAVSVISSQISGNYINGLGAAGASASGAGSATILIGSSLITANNNGLATAGSGRILTHGNNQLQGNSNNGAFAGNIGLQ